MAGLLAFSSCDKSGTEIREEGGAITISLSSAELETRATKEGDDKYNENTIKRIDWFLYEKGKTSGPAVKYGRVDNLNAKGEETIRVNVTEEEVNTLIFPKNLGKNVCDVFLIVNLPDGVTISGTSVAELKTLAIKADFASDTQESQDSFVMTGEGVATIVDRKKILAATGTIKVDRVASKISLTAKVANSIEVANSDGTTTTWVSNPETMKIQFCKGQSTAVLSGDPTAVAASSFDYKKRTYSKTSEETGFTIKKGDPFYSYPKTWNSGDKDAEPYLLIELPWSSQGGATDIYKSCYYKVFLSSEELVRNTWYDITLTLSVLGSFTETEPTVMITGLEYKVCNWSSKEFSAEIQAARYLVVDQNEYVMNNVDTLKIPFLSSHECTLVKEKVKVTKRDIKNGGDIDVTSGYNIDIVGSNIVYSKVLNNDYTSPTFDFVPYTITLTIQHKDDPNFTETITITQYPAIYGLDKKNSDYSNDDNINGDKNVWVNGYGRVSSKPNNWKYDYFASCPGMYSGENSSNYSPNMYVFTVTTLEGTPYIIGDPRTAGIDYDIVNATPKYNNQANSTWYKAKDLNGTERGLKYYYPTSGADSTKNMIAPKFRIASSYGVLHTSATASMSLDGMRKRCASYQEDGYPAGRWRLPTEAEFKFILSQVDKKSLPNIYVPNTPYWCAHGVGIPQGQGKVEMKDVQTYVNGNNEGCSTRCVYDEWYWGSEPALTGDAKSKFTWGDMPR